jgi:hypothetical protein
MPDSPTEPSKNATKDLVVLTWNSKKRSSWWAVLVGLGIGCVAIYFSLSYESPSYKDAYIRGEVVICCLIPIVLGTASLIVTINTRHTSIADRIRALVDEAYRLRTRQINAPKDREARIQEQVDLFTLRYHLTKLAISCAYISVGAILVASIAIVSQRAKSSNTIEANVAITTVVGSIKIETPTQPVQIIGERMATQQLGIFGKCPAVLFSVAVITFAISISACLWDIRLSNDTLLEAVRASGTAGEEFDAVFGPAQISLIPTFITRYHVLRDEQKTIGTDPAQSEKWAQRFWEFQNEQYFYYKNGLLPNWIYTTWLAVRWDDHKYLNALTAGEPLIPDTSSRYYPVYCWRQKYSTATTQIDVADKDSSGDQKLSSIIESKANFDKKANEAFVNRHTGLTDDFVKFMESFLSTPTRTKALEFINLKKFADKET